VIARDNGVCRVCSSHLFDAPDVHHTVELSEANCRDPAVSLNPALLITVCRDCHNRGHGKLAAGGAVKVGIVGEDLEIDYGKR